VRFNSQDGGLLREFPQTALVISGVLALLGGAFVFLWYRTVVSLPMRRRPAFTEKPAFKWPVPIAGLGLTVSGIGMLAAVSWILSAIAIAAVGATGFVIVKFDRYSAQIRIIHDRYQELRRARPDMEELEALFHTASWRYPQWSEDRILQLVAGKDIGSLILLIIISENQIHPITDWQLYDSLKTQVAKRMRASI
jgi:hypothetical protein